MNRLPVSVIIPCYRQAHWLPRAIKSCLDSSFAAPEIIVVDDGSPDDVSSSISVFGDKVRLVRQTNSGLSAARNKGIEHATNDHLLFLDSDDWLLPGSLVSLLEVANGKRIAVGGYYLANSEGVLPGPVIPAFDSPFNALSHANIAPPHCFMYPATFVKRMAGFRPIRGGHEDYDLLCRLCLYGCEFSTIHSPVSCYFQHPGSMSTKEEPMGDSRAVVWCAFAKGAIEKHPCNDTMAQLLDGGANTLKHTGPRDCILSMLQRIIQAIDDKSVGSSTSCLMRCLNGLAQVIKTVSGWQRSITTEIISSAEQKSLSCIRAVPIEFDCPSYRDALIKLISVLLECRPSLAKRIASSAPFIRGNGNLRHTLSAAALLAQLPIGSSTRSGVLNDFRSLGNRRRSRFGALRSPLPTHPENLCILGNS